MLTTNDSRGEATTEELELAFYSAPRADIRYDDALDGEGYVFVEYPRTEEEIKAPILTILY